MRARNLVSVLPTLNILILLALLMIKTVVAMVNMETLAPEILFLEGYLAVVWMIFTTLIYERV